MNWTMPDLMALPAGLYGELVAWMTELNDGRHR
jgi:hypothetical protein